MNAFYGQENGDDSELAYIDFEPEFGMAWGGYKTLQYSFLSISDPVCDMSSTASLGLVYLCLDKLKWAVSPETDPDLYSKDPGYMGASGIILADPAVSWATGVMTPLSVTYEKSSATDENVDDWEKYVIGTRVGMDRWEDAAWIGIVLGLTCICCQVGLVWMCIRENTMEKQLNSPGSTPDYNFGGGESNF